MEKNFRSKAPEYCEPVDSPDAGSGRKAKELQEGTDEDWEEEVQVDEDAPIARQDSDDPDEISTEMLDEVPEVHLSRHRKSSALDDGSGKRPGCRRKHRHRHGRRSSSRVPFDDVTSVSGPPRRQERKSSRLKESLELLQVQGERKKTTVESRYNGRGYTRTSIITHRNGWHSI